MFFRNAKLIIIFEPRKYICSHTGQSTTNCRGAVVCCSHIVMLYVVFLEKCLYILEKYLTLALKKLNNMSIREKGRRVMTQFTNSSRQIYL